MQSDTLTLERFVFALNQLGDHHRGTVCVRLLSSKFNDLTPFDPNTLSKHSQLLQCLVSISVALSRRMRRQLIAYFAVLRNYSYGLSISQLFTMVLNDEVVTDEDQTILVQGLAIIGASTQCFEYVNVYRKRNKLPEIAVNRDTLQVDQSMS